MPLLRAKTKKKNTKISAGDKTTVKIDNSPNHNAISFVQPVQKKSDSSIDTNEFSDRKISRKELKTILKHSRKTKVALDERFIATMNDLSDSIKTKCLVDESPRPFKRCFKIARIKAFKGRQSSRSRIKKGGKSRNEFNGYIPASWVPIIIPEDSPVLLKHNIDPNAQEIDSHLLRLSGSCSPLEIMLKTPAPPINKLPEHKLARYLKNLENMLKSISDGSLQLNSYHSNTHRHSHSVRSSLETVSMKTSIGQVQTVITPQQPINSIPIKPNEVLPQNGTPNTLLSKKTKTKRGPANLSPENPDMSLENNSSLNSVKKPPKVRRELASLVTWDAMIEAEKQGIQASDTQELLKQTLDIQMVGAPATESTEPPAYQQRARRAGVVIAPSPTLRHRQESSSSASSSINHVLGNGLSFNAPSTPSSVRIIIKPPSPCHVDSIQESFSSEETKVVQNRRRKIHQDNSLTESLESASKPKRGRPAKSMKINQTSSDSIESKNETDDDRSFMILSDSSVNQGDEIASPNSNVALPPRKRYKAGLSSTEADFTSPSEMSIPEIDSPKGPSARPPASSIRGKSAPLDLTSKKTKRTEMLSKTKSVNENLTVDTRLDNANASFDAISTPESITKSPSRPRGRPPKTQEIKRAFSSDSKVDNNQSSSILEDSRPRESPKISSKISLKPQINEIIPREKLPSQLDIYWQANSYRYESFNKDIEKLILLSSPLAKLLHQLLTELDPTISEQKHPFALPVFLSPLQPEFHRFSSQCVIMPGLPLSMQDLVRNFLEPSVGEDDDFWTINESNQDLSHLLGQLDKSIECMLLIWEVYTGRNSWLGKRVLQIKRHYLDLRIEMLQTWKSQGLIDDKQYKLLNSFPSGMLTSYGATLFNKPTCFGLFVAKKKNEKKLYERGCEVIRCLCGFRVEGGHVMVQCDTCASWQHLPCLWWALNVAMKPHIRLVPGCTRSSPVKTPSLPAERLTLCRLILNSAIGVSKSESLDEKSEELNLPYYCTVCLGVDNLTKEFPKNLAHAMELDNPTKVFNSSDTEFEYWSLSLNVSNSESPNYATDETMQILTDDYAFVHADWSTNIINKNSITRTTSIDSSSLALKKRRGTTSARDHIIIRIYRMWKNRSGEAWLEAGAFLRPYRLGTLSKESSHRWHEKEVVYDEESRLVMPLSALKGRCNVISPQTYRIGRPIDVPLPDTLFRDSVCPLMFICDKIIVRSDSNRISLDEIATNYLRVTQKPYCFLKHYENSPIRQPILRDKTVSDLDVLDSQTHLIFIFDVSQYEKQIELEQNSLSQSSDLIDVNVEQKLKSEEEKIETCSNFDVSPKNQEQADVLSPFIISDDEKSDSLKGITTKKSKISPSKMGKRERKKMMVERLKASRISRKEAFARLIAAQVETIHDVEEASNNIISKNSPPIYFEHSLTEESKTNESLFENDSFTDLAINEKTLFSSPRDDTTCSETVCDSPKLDHDCIFSPTTDQQIGTVESTNEIDESLIEKKIDINDFEKSYNNVLLLAHKNTERSPDEVYGTQTDYSPRISITEVSIEEDSNSNFDKITSEVEQTSISDTLDYVAHEENTEKQENLFLSDTSEQIEIPEKNLVLDKLQSNDDVEDNSDDDNSVNSLPITDSPHSDFDKKDTEPLISYSDNEESSDDKRSSSPNLQESCVTSSPKSIETSGHKESSANVRNGHHDRARSPGARRYHDNSQYQDWRHQGNSNRNYHDRNRYYNNNIGANYWRDPGNRWNQGNGGFNNGGPRSSWHYPPRRDGDRRHYSSDRKRW